MKANESNLEQVKAQYAEEMKQIKAQIEAEKEKVKLTLLKAREQHQAEVKMQRDQIKAEKGLEKEKAKLENAKITAKKMLEKMERCIKIQIKVGQKVSFAKYRSEEKVTATVTGYSQFRNGYVAYVCKDSENHVYQKSFNSVEVVK
jgi:co-chaperonin GroES (HSP10)